MTSGGLLINQSLVSLVTPNQYAAAAAGGFVANSPQPVALSVAVSQPPLCDLIDRGLDFQNILRFIVRLSLQCFDTVVWTAGRASGL